MTRRFRATGTLRSHDPHQDIQWSGGSGAWLWGSDGCKYLDCVSGYSANVLGHCHPGLVAALKDQASKLSFATGGESSLRGELEESICQVVAKSAAHHDQALSQRDSLKAWISTTGARAIEVAWRIAFQQRAGGLVTFDLGYHGRSIATSYVSDTAQQDCLMVGSSPAVRSSIPFPRVEAGSQACLQDACHESLKIFQDLVRAQSSSLSALLLEPAIGSRGYYFAPAEYFQRLVEIGREHGLLIISDEVQMGLGRLGGMVASFSQGWYPDLLVLGKALGGGILPISCVIGSAEMLDQLPAGYESETFAGSPLACRIAIEVLRIMESTEVVESSRSLHADLRSFLAANLPRDSVCGTGSATVIDFQTAVRNEADRLSRDVYPLDVERGTIAAYRCARLMRENGILVHVTGSQRDRIAIIPPLNIRPDEMNRVGVECVNAWHRFVREAFSGLL
ncbi:MAG: aminotransferase class III-fold pyridoxal phosphate-dependent enzyme [Pirellula sp.]